MSARPRLSAYRALARLREGNARYAADLRSLDALLSHRRKAEHAAGQRPFAIILGCSDSRVPAEVVFDQGLGDLFVIRVAGNVVASSQIGSVEFAADRFGTRLVVVLGHESCGVVQAVFEDTGTESSSLNQESIVGRVRAAVGALAVEPPAAGPELRARIAEAVRANVRHSVAALQSGSAILARLAEEDGLMIAGAVYSLESGRVDFLEREDDGGPRRG